MSAVFGAFAKYAGYFVIYAAVAVLGALCGKKINEKRNAGKDKETDSKNKKKK